MDDQLIAACLDETWRTIAHIRNRLGIDIGRVGQLASMLQRLADKGLIDRYVQETTAPKRGGGNLIVQFYRRKRG